MSQINSLVVALKKQLKAYGKTYADVAGILGISEASVKRMFAQQHFTLKRLETVCHAIDMELSELVQLAGQLSPRLQQLTEAQEREIVADIPLLVIAVSVINGYNYDELLSELGISDSECVQKLAKLDRLKIIDLLPGNRIKLRIAANFCWLTNGPIQQYFQEKVEQEFFRSRFDRDDEKLLVLNGIISSAANSELQENMERLAQTFNEKMQRDLTLPLTQRHGTTLVLAIRHWQYEPFKKTTKNSR